MYHLIINIIIILYVFLILFIMPDVKPIDEIKYDFKLSKHEVVPKLPMRAMIVGPSGSGKSKLLVSMILYIYRGAFERILIWSPSVSLDSIWLPVKKYIKEGLKVDNDKEPCWWDEFNVEDLERVIETQNKIIEYQKKQGMNKLFNILVILDDVSDNPAITRNNKLLNSLLCRGRHSGISTLVSLEKLSTVPPIIRVNISHLFYYKVRNYKELKYCKMNYQQLLEVIIYMKARN